MRKIYIVFLAVCLVFTSSCEKYLDVNTNPNAPQDVAANLYLAPMIHWMVSSPQFDGRFIGRYTQNWYLPSTSITTWDRQGYDPASDNGAQLWRDVYWTLGQNLINMIEKAEAEQRWESLPMKRSGAYLGSLYRTSNARTALSINRIWLRETRFTTGIGKSG